MGDLEYLIKYSADLYGRLLRSILFCEAHRQDVRRRDKACCWGPDGEVFHMTNGADRTDGYILSSADHGRQSIAIDGSSDLTVALSVP